MRNAAVEEDSACRFLITSLQILSASSMVQRSILFPEVSCHSAANISQMKWLSRASIFVLSVSSFWRKAILTKFSKPGLGSWVAAGLEKYSIRGTKVWVFELGICCCISVLSWPFTRTTGGGGVASLTVPPCR